MPETPVYDLSPADVGEIVGVAANTVKRWASEGHLPGIRFPNGYWRFRRDDVDAFIDRIRTSPPKDEPVERVG